MADYHSPTVVDPVIPLTAMTPLEHLVLGHVFDVEEEHGGLYFHSRCGPDDMVTIPLDELREACEASRGQAGSVIGAHVETLIEVLDAKATAEADEEVDLDLSDPDIYWDRILQDIVRRSPTLDEIVVWAAFTCTRMRSDGFGGAVTRVTAASIQYESTDRMLGVMRRGTVSPAPTDIPADTSGHQTLGRLDDLAALAGWDPFDLTLRISAWAERQGHAAALTQHLARLAAGEPD